jgi:hypothetical protein
MLATHIDIESCEMPTVDGASQQELHDSVSQLDWQRNCAAVVITDAIVMQWELTACLMCNRPSLQW